MALLVRRPGALAAPAAVQVARDDASAAEGAAQTIAELVLFGMHRAIRLREQQLARRGVERGLEVRHQVDRDGHGFFSAALGGLAVVRPAHHQKSTAEVDVTLAQTEQLALAQTSVERR